MGFWRMEATKKGSRFSANNNTPVARYMRSLDDVWWSGTGLRNLNKAPPPSMNFLSEILRYAYGGKGVHDSPNSGYNSLRYLRRARLFFNSSAFRRLYRGKSAG